MSDEREINLIDLLAEMLRHWKGAVVFLIIGAVAFGTYSYIKSSDAVNKSTDNQVVEKQDREIQGLNTEKLSTLEKIAVEQALINDESYVQAKEYEESTLYMQFDSANIPAVKVSFSIEASADIAYEAEQAYEVSFSKTELSKMISDKLHIDENVTDFITFTSPKSLSEKGARFFSIACVYPREEDCGLIGDTIEEYVRNLSDKMQDTIGTHTINVVDVIIASSEDVWYLSKQQEIVKDTIKKKQDLLTSLDGLNETQLSIFYGNGNSEFAEHNTGSVSIKKTIIIAVLFAFLYLFIWVIKYLFDQCIKSSDDMKQLIGSPQLGKIVEAKEPKFFVDRWIYKLKYRRERIFPIDKAIELIAANISVNAKNREKSAVTIVGCSLENKASEYCSKLAEGLKDTYKIDANVLDDIVYNQKALETLADAKSVVLVETVGSTMYSDLAKEVQAIRQLDIEILGGVIVD